MKRVKKLVVEIAGTVGMMSTAGFALAACYGFVNHSIELVFFGGVMCALSVILTVEAIDNVS